MSALPLAQAAGRVLVAGFAAGPVDPVVADMARRGSLGGIILFRRNIPSLHSCASLLAEYIALHRLGSQTPPLLAVDQEGGRVARLGAPVIALPPMLEFAAQHAAHEIERTAGILGRQLRTLGFNFNMAPVLDVDTNPDNPIIGDRAFGKTPDDVIARALPFADGLMGAGILACGKHFPGHGDTDLDSHLALPRLPHDLERLRNVELAPFAAAQGRVPAIMTAHVVFEAIDPQVPATLSRAVMHDLLRVELGYDGAIVSDDLEMKAVANHFGAAEAAVMAIAAGCDVLLVCSDVERLKRIHEALIHEAEAKPAFRERLLDAAHRAATLANKVPAPTPFDGDQQALEMRLSALGHSGYTAAP